eukprot:jgi/Chlat1/4047/Chrsp26S04099
MNEGVASPPAAQKLLSGFTRLSKAIAGVLVLGYAVSVLIPTSNRYLALMPGKTLPCVWNLVTAGYFENKIISVILDVLAVLVFGKVLEPIWGSKTFLKFIAYVNFSTGFCTFVLMYLLFFLTRHERFLYGTGVNGFAGVVAGFLVAIKQLMPEQELRAVAGLKLRAKHLPSIFVLLSVILCVVTEEEMALPFILFGTYSSWLYLRYFQEKLGNLKGDPSEDFAFHTFFPEPLHPIVSRLSTVVERLFCGMVRKPAQTDPSQVLANHQLPGSDPVDASRRRERGARALEERLAAAVAEDVETGTSESATKVEEGNVDKAPVASS